MRRVALTDEMRDGEVALLLQQDGDEIWLFNRNATLEEVCERVNAILERCAENPLPRTAESCRAGCPTAPHPPRADPGTAAALGA